MAQTEAAQPHLGGQWLRKLFARPPARRLRKAFPMQARMRWWLFGIIALVLVSLVGVLEPVKLRDRKDPNTGETVPPLKQIGPLRFYRPHIGLKLGLDLRGGSHLVLQAQPEGLYEFTIPELAESVTEERRAELYAEIVSLLPRETIGTEKRNVEIRDQRVVVRTRVTDEADTVRQGEVMEGLLAEAFPELEKKVAQFQPITRDSLISIERIIENRVNPYGVTEPIIQRQPPDRIIVELPGMRDPEQAKNMIRQTAVLEFRHIPRKYAFGERGPEVSTVDGREVFTFVDPLGNEVPTSEVIDESPVIVTGRDLKPGTSRVISMGGQPVAVSFELPGEAGQIFEDFTRSHLRHFLAVVLDGQMISCPVIKSTIRERGVIEGGFDSMDGLERARDLSILLNAGALPFDLEYVEDRTVSAQLGQDALVKSLWAGLIGLGLVLVFMAAYYRVPGLVANVALVIFLILLMGLIKLVNQRLTLPGILAVILSIGMAVDANIIIFERLKEEIRTGKTMRSAVDAAFKRAWAAIVDSNVCSIGTGIVLYMFGTGPIKGFAVALILGVAVSLFTAVTVSRLFMNMLAGSRWARNVALFGVSPSEVEGA